MIEKMLHSKDIEMIDLAINALSRENEEDIRKVLPKSDLLTWVKNIRKCYLVGNLSISYMTDGGFVVFSREHVNMEVLRRYDLDYLEL